MCHLTIRRVLSLCMRSKGKKTNSLDMWLTTQHDVNYCLEQERMIFYERTDSYLCNTLVHKLPQIKPVTPFCVKARKMYKLCAAPTLLIPLMGSAMVCAWMRSVTGGIMVMW